MERRPRAVALAAMLEAFYPHATPATLTRARRERPEYFAGAAAPLAGRDEGPIAPLDVDQVRVTLSPPDFTSLAADALGDVAPHHDALDIAHQVIVGASDPAPFDAQSGAPLADAESAHSTQSGAFDQADPSDVLGAANAARTGADGARGDWDDPPPHPRRPRDPDGDPPSGRRPPHWDPV